MTVGCNSKLNPLTPPSPAGGEVERSNIALLLTPPLPGAIATIRLIGPRIPEFAQHLSRPPMVGRCVHCELRDLEGTTIDDPVVVAIDPSTIELHLHGGPAVIEATFGLLQRLGFERARWEERPGIAFDADDKIERQMLLDVGRAGTVEALRILLAQPEAWREMLRSNDRTVMRRAMSDRSLERLLSHPTVAIVGPPNVGKSTLANALFGRSRSITADMPGTTRDWVGELANIDGLLVCLIDTPGFRTSGDALETAAIKKSAGPIAAADLLIIVTDATSAVSFDAMPTEAAMIRVVNKCDLVRASSSDALAISALTGKGIDVLRTKILEAFGCRDLGSLHARCWSDAQRDELRKKLC